MDTPSSPQELQQAFLLFNQVSEQLTQAYSELQVQVEQLTQELAVANGELRRQFEEKEALSRRLGYLLAALPGGVVVLNSEGMVEEINPTAMQWLKGASPGCNWNDAVATMVQPTLTPNEWLLGEGDRRINISESPREVEGGKILLLQDVTEAYTKEDQLQRHKRLSAMGEMAAALAHQLRTPLAAAMLYTSQLSDSNLAPNDRAKFSERALARLHYLEKLISDMLVFVRGGRNASEKIAASTLIADVQQVLEPQMSQCELVFNVVDNSLGATILGSREALAGALNNLLVNAMQACKKGGRITFSVEHAQDNRRVFCIDDTGKGIAETLQNRLFEPFFTTRTDGTGLGLAIVREVVQIHGGEIKLKSEINVGTTFFLYFPISS